MGLLALVLFTAGLGGQEAVELPVLRHAVEDRVAPDEFRPVLEIQRDGRIRDGGPTGLGGPWLYEPEVDDAKPEPFGRVRAWLVATAGRMDKAHADPENGAGPLLPDDALLIRPDRRTPFRYVRQVLDLCVEPETKIWKIQLAGRGPGGSNGRVAVHLPEWYLPTWTRISWVREVAEVQIHVRGPRDDEDRSLVYSIANFVTQDLEALGRLLAKVHRQRAALGEDPIPFAIDARSGTTYQDVAAVLDVVLDAGNVEVEFFSFVWPPDLPTVRHAVEDRLAPGEFRPVLEISEDGWIGVAGQWLHVPELDDEKEEPFGRVRSWLAETAQKMKKDRLGKENRTGPMIPDEALLIRPDGRTPFHHLQAVMELCGEHGIMIWKIQFAARTTSGAEGRFAAHLSKRIGTWCGEPIVRIDIRIECDEAGALQYSVGSFETTDLAAFGRRLANLHRHYVPEEGRPLDVVVDPRPGTLYRDVTPVLDEILDAGFTEFLICGAY